MSTENGKEYLGMQSPEQIEEEREETAENISDETTNHSDRAAITECYHTAIGMLKKQQTSALTALTKSCNKRQT